MSTGNPQPPKELANPGDFIENSETVPVQQLPNFLSKALSGLQKDFDAQVAALGKSLIDINNKPALDRAAKALKEGLVIKETEAKNKLWPGMNQLINVIAGQAEKDQTEKSLRKIVQECIVYQKRTILLFMANWKTKAKTFEQ